MKRILFVCTGNTCRSPMAEMLARTLARKEGLDLQFRSAGTAALDGQAMARNAKRILEEQGINASFSSQLLGTEQAAWADLILTMTENHKRQVIQQFPQTVEKTFALKEYVEDDPKTIQLIEESTQLITDLQLKQALGQKLSEQEKSRVKLLQQKLPGYDISDPFGHDLDTYRRCAEEIKACLLKLLGKLPH